MTSVSWDLWKGFYMSENKMINFIQKAKNRIFSRKIPAKSIYADFAPIENLSSEKESLKALHWALNNRRIKNIALTGPYGAGKSSVIESYLKQHKKCKAINISLATFDGHLWDKIQELKEKQKYSEAQIALAELEDVLEKGILKQLFYKVDADKIPRSRYRKLHHIRLWKYIMGVVIAAGVCAAITYLIFPDKVIIFIDSYISGISSINNIVVDVGAFLVAVSGIGYVIRFVTSKFAIKEISVGDVSAKGEEISKDSVLNKNIDEMLYFFERTKYNVVFIEDLDRFNRTSIFIKLREINTILNKYEVLKKRIVFVYAVRDDLFKEETERTKFFDFLIPVIPVINSTNSGEIMRNLLGLGDAREENREYPDHDISQKFITLVSPYIGDMRVLISTINEFWIYKRTLKEGPEVRLDDEYMLSLMIYKNLYPQDFALLEAETGNIKHSFNYKKEAIRIAREKLEEEKNKINLAQSDTLKHVREIKLVMLTQMANNGWIVRNINVDGYSYNFTQLLSDDLSFDIFKGKRILVYTYDLVNGSTNNINIDNVENSSDEMKILFNRYDARVKYKHEEKESAIRELEDIENKITRLRASTLQQLIQENSVEEVLPEEVRKNDLLVFLLRHGYINESYSDYINYFHPGSISKDELNFILSIRNYKAINDFSYPIKHCSNVIDRLYDYEFEQTETLNFDLTDFLLKSKTNELKLEKLVKQLVNNSEISQIFIKNYIDRGKNANRLLPILCHESQRIWLNFLLDEQLSNEKKDNYLKLIIEHCDVDDIENNNVSYEDEEQEIYLEPTIKEYFEDDENILEKMSSISWEKLKQVVINLEISFHKLNLNGLEEQVVNDIIDENLFEINSHMLKEIQQIKNPDGLVGLFESNYGHIQQLGIDTLIDYVHENFYYYVKNIILGIDTNTEESAENVENIIQRLFENNRDLCLAVIEKEHFAHWEKLTDCLPGFENNEKQQIWEYLLINDRTEPTWENYMIYHNLFGLNDVLVQFIDRNMDKVLNSHGFDELTDTLFKELMIEELTDDNFEKLIGAYKIDEFTSKCSEFSERKLEVMIHNHYFEFSPERYIEIKEISSKLSNEFVKENISEFIKSKAECKLVLNDIKGIIRLNVLSETETLSLLEYLVPDDIDEEFALLVNEFDFLIPKEYVVSSWQALSDKDKYQLLYKQMYVFNLDEIAVKFCELGGPYNQFSERTRHKFVLYPTDFNKDLCEKLLDKEFISSWDETDEKVDSDPITFKDKYEKRITGYVRKKPDK